MEKLNWLISTFIGAFFSFFGILAIPLLLLVPCNVIDYFTGIGASKKQGIKITSNTGFWGIVKKVLMYILIFVGFVLDTMIGYILTVLNIDISLPFICSAIVASWLVINELISITENCDIMGVNVPLLSPILSYVKKKIETKVDIKEEE